MNKPQRIISLVPSQTELLYSLGLDAEVIGITKFCVHPHDWHQTKTKIGGTKNINISKILSLQPDLVIANKEENVKEQVEALQSSIPVHLTDVDSFTTALKMIGEIGELVQRSTQASLLIEQIQLHFTELERSSLQATCTYLIWKDPYMTIGGDTFINDMLQFINCKNVFADRLRYPVITVEDIRRSNCDYLFLSSEPYPFREKHIQELQAELPNTKITLVDGEMFSWYGSRLLHAAPYFSKLLQSVARQ